MSVTRTRIWHQFGTVSLPRAPDATVAQWAVPSLELGHAPPATGACWPASMHRVPQRASSVSRDYDRDRITPPLSAQSAARHVTAAGCPSSVTGRSVWPARASRSHLGRDARADATPLKACRAGCAAGRDTWVRAVETCYASSSSSDGCLLLGAFFPVHVSIH